MPRLGEVEYKAVRRRAVASLRLRGYSIRQIAAMLPMPNPDTNYPGIKNPNTGKPYSHETIRKDCQWLDKQWLKAAQEDTAMLRARQLAELQEARFEVWRGKDYPEVRRSLEFESTLMGTQEGGTESDVTFRVVFEGKDTE